MSGFPAFAASLLLAAGVAAAVSAVTLRVNLERIPRIASVRLSSLTADYVTKTIREGGDRKAAAEAARDWAGRLEEALAKYGGAPRRGAAHGGRRRSGRQGFDLRGRGGDGGDSAPNA